MINIYLLAVNLFALIALLLGLHHFTKNGQSYRLAPLFLLVTSRALMVIFSFLLPSEIRLPVIAALDVFSTYCLVWALTVSLAHLPRFWFRLAWLASGMALLLSGLPLLPAWPIPFQIHSLTISIFGLPFILLGLGRLSWLHLAAPLCLALANFFSLLEMTSLVWLLTLLAYGFLVVAIHWESVLAWQDQQQESAAATLEALNQSQERQRWLEVSEIISAVPSMDQAMAHLARTMAHVTHADQAAIFILDINTPSRFRLIEIYSPERPVTLTGRYDQTFALADFPLFETVIGAQRQIVTGPLGGGRDLASLCALWFEERVGPTLLQPLVLQGQSVGALLLANPVTQRAIRPGDQELCRGVARQIATMVEAQRRYLDLEQRTRPEPAPAEAAPVQELATSERAPALVEAAVQRAETARLAAPAPTKPALVKRISQPDQTKVIDYTVADHLTILEAVHEGVVVGNAKGRVCLVNKAAERILNVARRDLLDQPISAVYGQINSTDQIEELAAAFSRRNEPLPTFAQRGEQVIQGQLIPWRNKDKEWRGIIAVFKDVTQQLKTDQAHRDFITALSRELRAPLTTIKGYSELIIRGSMASYTPEQVHLQQIMHSSVDRMVAVLDNAIQIGAQTKNSVVPRFETIAPGEVIEQVMRDISPLAELHELTLTQEINVELPLIIADRKQLYRILENLLENGCRFTPPGGFVTLRAWIQHERTGNAVSPKLMLLVADNGIGIPKSEFGRIFDPFYQIPNVLEPGGMGMGLAVVKELVELHHGRVWVESTEGEGSIFQVALPLSQD